MGLARLPYLLTPWADMNSDLPGPHAILGFVVRNFDLELARLGDGDALARLISRSRRALVSGIGGIALRMGMHGVDAEDVFQDTVVCCFGAIRSMRADTERGFRAWFLGIARNHLLESARKGHDKRTKTAGAGDDFGLILVPHFENFVGPLKPPGCQLLWNQEVEGRSVLMLRGLFHLAWSDVATVLSRPSGHAARGLHTRARRHIDDPEYMPMALCQRTSAKATGWCSGVWASPAEPRSSLSASFSPFSKRLHPPPIPPFAWRG